MNKKAIVFSTIEICVFLLFGLNGCGYFSSGTWEDDPHNWERAFRSKKPDDVVVLHSWFWRSPHWSYEFQYFFEIEHNDSLEKQLFEQNKLIKLDGKDATDAKNNYIVEPPDWFAPKAVDEYEIWVFEDEPERNFRVFVDKETGNLYLTDYLV